MAGTEEAAGGDSCLHAAHLVKPEEVEGDDEKQGVPEKSKRGHRVLAGRGEAAAGHIETPRQVEAQRPEKYEKQGGEKENAARNPEP